MSSNTNNGRIIVVGAGITGLTAAYRLRQAGYDVTVLEATNAIGGKMSSLRRDGFTLDRGATMLPTGYDAIRKLIADTGLADSVSEIDMTMGIVRNSAIHVLRTKGVGMATDGLRTPLLSLRSKMQLGRLALDVMRSRKSLSYDDPASAVPLDTETVESYANRRFGEEARNYAIDAITRALYLVDMDDLSVVDLLFAGKKFLGTGLLRHRGGIDFVCHALAAGLDVRTSACVTTVERGEDCATVSWLHEGREHTEKVSGCVLAVGGPQVPALYPQLDAVQRDILTNHIQYGAIIAGRHALSTRPATQAVLVAVPSSEHPGLGLIKFNHHTEPDCAPPGKGLISTFWVSNWGRRRMDRSDQELLDEMIPAVDRFVPGFADSLLFTNIERWDPATMVSYPGMYRYLDAFTKRMDPNHRVQLAGDYFGNPGTNGCAESAERAARRLIAAMRRQPAAVH